jgi:hypothetical protein
MIVIDDPDQRHHTQRLSLPVTEAEPGRVTLSRHESVLVGGQVIGPGDPDGAG